MEAIGCVMAIKIPGNYRLGIRTKKACEIARIDPARFNEAVHAGNYPCAPKTRAGAVRIFDLDQTVSLMIYGHLLAMSVTTERAGEIACSAYELFGNQKNVALLVYERDPSGEWSIKEESAFTRATAPSVMRLVFDIAELREQIEEHFPWLDEWNRRKDDAAS
jgi:hypothetical protein